MAIMNREVSQLAGFCDVKKLIKVPRRFSGLNEQQSHQRKGQQIPEIMSDSLAVLAPAHSIWHTGSRTFSQHLLTFHPCLSSEWLIVYLALLYRASPSSTCTHTHRFIRGVMISVLQGDYAAKVWCIFMSGFASALILSAWKQTVLQKSRGRTDPVCSGTLGVKRSGLKRIFRNFIFHHLPPEGKAGR